MPGVLGGVFAYESNWRVFWEALLRTSVIAECLFRACLSYECNCWVFFGAFLYTSFIAVYLEAVTSRSIYGLPILRIFESKNKLIDQNQLDNKHTQNSIQSCERKKNKSL